MSPPTTCPHCGAQVTDLASRFCGHCGTALPRDEPPAPSSVPFADKDERFAALAEHAQTKAWLEAAPSGPDFTLVDALPLALGAIGAVVVGLFAAAIASTTCLPLGLVPLVLAGVLAAGMVQQITRGLRLAKTPATRRLALVVEERTNVSGGGEDLPAKTKYFVTLETPDGQREELELPGELAGQLTRGDMGVAFSKETLLIEFGRVPV